MHTTECREDDRMTYYVPGSGLIAVPRSRINDIPKFKAEFHKGEVEWALAFAKARKPA